MKNKNLLFVGVSAELKELDAVLVKACCSRDGVASARRIFKINRRKASIVVSRGDSK